MEEWYLRTSDGCRLYVVEVGDGPETLIVLHGGFGSEHSYLRDPVERLALPYRTVFYDQRGSLRSPAALEQISVDHHLDDLEQLHEELGVDRVWLFAHSMGTLLAMMYATRQPGRVSGMVLVSPMLPVRPLPANLVRDHEAHVERVRNRWERLVADEMTRAGVDREGLSDRDEYRRQRIESGGPNLFHVERWREGAEAFVNVPVGETAGGTLPRSWDFRDALRSTDAVTVILGDHDWTAPATLYGLFQSVPDVALTIVPEAGHYVWIDQPNEFRTAMLAALLTGSAN